MLNDALAKVQKTVQMLKAELMPTTEDNSLSFLSFNEDNYYYSRLTEPQKTVYSIILAGLLKIEKEISIPLLPIEEISTTFSAVTHDNPMLFYVSAFSLSSGMYSSHCSFIPNYKYDRQFILQNIKIINEFLHVFDKIKTKSDIEKEIYVHDFCLNNFTYDYSFDGYSYSVLGPILNKKAVCEGIAKCTKLIFDYLGVTSLVVSGEANNPLHGSQMEGHAWNIVLIDGKTYHLDVTWDICLTKNTKRYDYFNLCDNDIKKDHVITDVIPVCSTDNKDYYSLHSMIVSEPSDLEDYIDYRLKREETQITFKIKNLIFSESILKQIQEISQTQYLNNSKYRASINMNYNPSQMVFEIFLQ